MIRDHDRSSWFGASDTHCIMGNWQTASFTRWWCEKLGLLKNTYTSDAMRAGTAYEHRILEHMGIARCDRQIKVRRLRLRVNLDGEDKGTVYEVKTYGGERFKLSRAHWMQCQVQMYVTGKGCVLAAYRLLPGDYENYFNQIDGARLTRYPVAADVKWVRGEYLPRLEHLARCLQKGVYPDENAN